MIEKKDLKKIKDFVWEISKTYRNDMRVPARIYASEKLLEMIWKDKSLEQLANTATLPGVFGYTLAMPDIHEGYGAPIGGVIPIDLSNPAGVISPGATGYDLNCGLRLLKSSLLVDEIKPFLPELIEALFRKVPSGVGSSGPIKLSEQDYQEVLETGVNWAVKHGYGAQEDIENCENNGFEEGADIATVSDRAKERGRNQLGTLGSGNHFLEIQMVEKIFLPEIAEKFGLFQGQFCIMIHSGSRGLGHQVCTDYVRVCHQALAKYQIKLPDPELACVPFNSQEGQNYFKAMKSAANYAYTNRHIIGHWVRLAWREVAGSRIKKDLALHLLYDLGHNISRIETFQLTVDLPRRQAGRRPSTSKLLIHRKGAARAYPDQPVIIPGSMGTASYVLVGTEQAKTETFASTCHGAGRVMSRSAAKRQIWGSKLAEDLKKKGIIPRTHSMSGLAEEAPIAYKDIDEVVNVVDRVGIAKRVARLVPLGVIKG